MTGDSNIVPISGPWKKVTLSRAEYEAEARADLAAMEDKALAQVRESFARHRERLERDFLRLAHDLSMQRGELRGAPPADVH